MMVHHYSYDSCLFYKFDSFTSLLICFLSSLIFGLYGMYQTHVSIHVYIWLSSRLIAYANYLIGHGHAGKRGTGSEKVIGNITQDALSSRSGQHLREKYETILNYPYIFMEKKINWIKLNVKVNIERKE